MNQNTNATTIADDEQIGIIGARSHNLKDISLTIPRNQLVVMTGLSGSGPAYVYLNGQVISHRRYTPLSVPSVPVRDSPESYKGCLRILLIACRHH